MQILRIYRLYCFKVLVLFALLCCYTLALGVKGHGSGRPYLLNEDTTTNLHKKSFHRLVLCVAMPGVSTRRREDNLQTLQTT